MTTTNPRRQCERLWAANKYLVLSHSNKIYLEIRNYLKNDEVSLDQVQAYIDQALDLPENPGQVVNAFQHIWGPNWKAMRQVEFLSSVWWHPSKSSSSSTQIAIWRSQL